MTKEEDFIEQDLNRRRSEKIKSREDLDIAHEKNALIEKFS